MSKGNKKSKKTYMIAVFLIVLVIIISIAIPLTNNKNEITPIEITKQNNGLPKLERFETLFKIAQENKDSYGKNMIADAATEAGTAQNESTKSVNDYSKTNVQVEGVDEADIVKTDGKYIYYIANNKVIIVDTEEEMRLASQIDYNNKDGLVLQELYVKDDKLIVIGYGEIYKKIPIRAEVVNDEELPIYHSEYENKTVARIYDLDNIEEPTLKREICIDGRYLSSRMINDNLYFIANKNIYLYVSETKKIEDFDEEEYKINYKDSLTNEEKTIGYEDIYYFPDSEEMSYLNIAAVNINKDEQVNVQAYLGAGEYVYMSQNNLYVSTVKYEYKNTMVYGYVDDFEIDTYIYKFNLDDSNVTYKGTGNVAGEPLNQFSMDEKDGYFRIATTDYTGIDSDISTNNLFVLDEEMQTIGSLENLAKGEEIYSVRFMGNRAYIVTFVQTDPLFVIDLKDPTTPYVLGELKIPGFSNYLHPYDETHIIGLGQNTKTNENGGVVTNGMKMALFDVSNPNNPVEMFSENIGEQGTYSEALNNHKAFLFSKEKNLLALPIHIVDETEDNYLQFQGAVVYNLDLENGFSKKGEITHKESTDEENSFIYDYFNEVNRIIYINDNLYTLSNKLIKCTNMETMEEQSKLELD